LSKKYTIVNGANNLLRRTASIQPAHKGGDRGMSNHMGTLSTSSFANNLANPVVLLDDVTTTGNSLRAGILKLQRANVKIVAAIALGKTVI